MNRYFVAVVPLGLERNGELKKLVGKMKRTLSDRGVEARWMPPELYHVTLRFVGEMQPTRVEAFLRIMAEWEFSIPGLSLSLHGIGAFPRDEHARVLWVGVHQNQQLLDLHASLESHLVWHGFAEAGAGLIERHAGGEAEGERRNENESGGREAILPDYVPHVTLARLRDSHSLTDVISLGGRKSFGDYPIREVVVFESVLQGKIPKYIPRLRRPI